MAKIPIGGIAGILFLTGLDDVMFIETGLDAGADDYLTKPFELRELGARLRSILRKNTTATQSASLNFGKGGKLTVKSREISNGTASEKLTIREFSLLEFFLKHRNTFYSSEALLELVWPAESEATDGTVRTCFKTLRHKLQKLGLGQTISTYQGQGYILEE